MRYIYRIIGVIGALFFMSGVAFGQGSISATGGWTGPQGAPAEVDAHMANIPPTPNVMVDGQNDGDNIAGNKFLPWRDAVKLGRAHYLAQHAPESLGDVARRYRKPVVTLANGRYSCPEGWDVNGSEPEARGGDSDYVHCTRAPKVVRP
jgi:hypothetical protein